MQLPEVDWGKVETDMFKIEEWNTQLLNSGILFLSSGGLVSIPALCFMKKFGMTDVHETCQIEDKEETPSVIFQIFLVASAGQEGKSLTQKSPLGSGIVRQLILRKLRMKIGICGP